MADIDGTDNPDFLAGTPDDDRIFGFGGADNIFAYDGNDTIYGHGGSDNLRGGTGNDRLFGGDDRDQLNGEEGNDYLHGGNGADQLFGFEGQDWLIGETGDDGLDGGMDNDRLFGGIGHDRLLGRDGNDLLKGGRGDDHLAGGPGADRIFGGDGYDILSFLGTTDGTDNRGIVLDLANMSASSPEVLADVFSEVEAFEGTYYDDVMNGTNGDDEFFGHYGNDVIRGRGGNDTIWTGPAILHPLMASSPAAAPEPSGGATTIGGTKLYGGNGDDKIYATPSTTALVSGGSGNDFLSGGHVVRAGDGDDEIHVSSEDGTFIFGGNGNDTIIDSYGHDTINAGAGNDVLVFDGLHGSVQDEDIARMGAGRDLVWIATNRDEGLYSRTIDGGTGLDTLAINWDASMYNVKTGSRFVDFRKQENGTWLDLGDLKVRNFETVWYQATAKVQTVHLGANDDHFRGAPQSDFRNTYVYGHGGDDYLDSGNDSVHYLYGGRGNDRIVADGSTSEAHRAFGQSGDDLLFGGYMAAEARGETRLFGGEGADGFIFTEAGRTDRIMDFDPDQDWIGLNFSGYYPLFPADLAIDPQTTTRKNLATTLLADDAYQLKFSTQSIDRYGKNHVKTISYDKQTGHLTVDDSIYTLHTKLMAKLKGAPELRLDHFFGMTTVSESGQVSPFDPLVSVAAMEVPTTWDLG